jgi:excisionase family DNA binding protein
MPQLVKVPEAAKLLAISEKTLWAWVAGRRIEVVRIGRAVRIPTKAIEQLIEQGTTPARA